jgi:HEAT repeat protein
VSAANSKARTVEKELEALGALDPAAPRDVQKQTIQQALGSKQQRVVARAATLVGERNLHELIPDLLAAWPRFMDSPVKKDPRCLAKTAITAALFKLEFEDPEFWLAGMRYRQQEPGWGTAADSAVDIRCNSALALANSRYSRATAELALLLNDPERGVRSGAARAISCCNPHEAEPLLRFKVAVGDADPEVMGECFSGLLTIAPEESMALVAERLRDSDAGVADYAALALGESRHPAALKPLQDTWSLTPPSSELRQVLARAAALHRSDAAMDWLLGIVERGDAKSADIAADALSVFDRNDKLMERVKAAQAARER